MPNGEKGYPNKNVMLQSSANWRNMLIDRMTAMVASKLAVHGIVYCSLSSDEAKAAGEVRLLLKRGLSLLRNGCVFLWLGEEEAIDVSSALAVS